MSYFFRKSSIFIVIVLILSIFFTFQTLANSAKAYWSGTTTTGAIVNDDTCPLIVENEILTFDIQEFPKQYYEEIPEYLSYNGKVTAEYTFYNPSNYNVSATLLFPFGSIPDYGYMYDEETGERIVHADTEKYNIAVNGNIIEKTLRYTLTTPDTQFELSKDLALLYDGYMIDDFYNPDMPVIRYTYVPENVDLETYDAATAAFVISPDQSKTRVLMENQSGGMLLDDAVQLEGWVKNGEFIVNVIGEPLNQMPEWKFYENGACEKEIAGDMVLTNTEITTLKQLALSAYNENIMVSEQDWYNAVVESMKSLEWSNGVILGSEFEFDVSYDLMRWYEYHITLEPGERIVNTVTAPIYPSFQNNYNPPIYEYTYLLSPAKTWKSFGNLDIIVNTPFYMIKSAPEWFEHIENSYVLNLTGLPEEELTFTLCSEPKLIMSASDNSLITILLFVLCIGIIAIIAIWIGKRITKHKF